MWTTKQFITWTISTEGVKLPTDPHTGKICNAHDQSLWLDYETARQTGRPVAFVLRPGGEHWFLDIDHCQHPDGRWNETAEWFCQQFSGCYAEISQSGDSLHIIGQKPVEVDHCTRNNPLGLEFYTKSRFIALTGTGAVGDPDHIPDAGVYSNILQTYFPARTPAQNEAPTEWTTQAVPEWSGPEDDQELIDRMLKAKSVQAVVNGGVALSQLWHGDSEALAIAYPDVRGSQGRAFDWSLADAALVQHLAFWTGKNCERIDRLWGLSALGQRDKYHDRLGYRHDTILRAVGLCKNVYRQRQQLNGGENVSIAGIRTGFQYLTPQDQQDLFKDCVYVRDQHKVFVPDGDLLKPEQFKAIYGGRVFALDGMGDKSTRNAWEAFTESQAIDTPWAHSICFRPEHDSGAILTQEGRNFVNTYVPIPTESRAGDIGPFLGLLNKLLPVSHDREILLAYMAACVQYPGIKFQWCPLIQGVQGNGKSFLGTALTACIGEKYTHIVDPKDIGNIFNAWVHEKLLAIIEEIHTRGRGDIIDSLKPLITNMRLPVQGKGKDQITGDNRANFIMFTNHRDAIRKTRDDRRFAVFYTAQQSFDDLERYGMGGSYFPDLYEWGRGGGFAAVNHYLRNYQIPAALNPARDCHRAPETSSTTDAIIESMGGVEQRIMEVCEEGRPGFIDGWASSMALDKLLQEIRVNVPINKRRGILEDLGYIQHPALYRGRLNSMVVQEGGKPVLYIKKGHVACNILKPPEVHKVYCEAQGYAVVGNNMVNKGVV